ncbi:hypothetical protein [Microbacterium luticocti]|uniref:hypothetical protein n=1 Tax=Microbacterium luticocti TaxID=451764 RepID=UPI0012EBB7A1|nr:hypothetical protein [Microbacterium luticocti]
MTAVAQRIATVLVLFVVVGFDKGSAHLLEWDATWYRGIITRGYQLGRDDGTPSNLAFFPLYPMTAKLLAALPFVSTGAAMLMIGIAGAVVAAVPIFLIGKHLHSVTVGFVLAMLWGAMPQSIVLVMGYPEGLFTAATAFGLLFLLRKQPVAAAVATCLAGLIRPSALPLILVVMVWSFVNLCHKPRQWRWWVSTGLAPLGTGVYLIYIAYRTGDLFGYFAIQRDWNLRFGKPWELVLQAHYYLTTNDSYLVSMDIYLPIVVAFVLLVIMLAGRWRWPGYSWIVLYTIVAAALVVTRATFFWSESRQFLVLFPLLLPLATIKTSRWAWVITLIVGTVASAYFGTMLLSAFQYSP